MSGLVVALLLASDAGVDLAERLRASVVQVIDRDSNGRLLSTGSGFIATADGLVITNHHVIEGMRNAQVRLGDGGVVTPDGVLLDDSKQDIAALKIPGEGYLPLALDLSEPRVGSYAALLAAPVGLSWTFSEGIVAAYRPDGLPKELLGDDVEEGHEADRLPVVQFTLPTAAGASGGPIVNADGAVLAIVRAGVGEVGSIVFGIPAKAIAERIQAAKVATYVEPRTSPRWRNLGISAAFFLGLAVWWVYRSRARRY